MSKILQKILVVLLLSIIFISYASNMVGVSKANTQDSIIIEKIGRAKSHLKYVDSITGESSDITPAITGHYQYGFFYPVYYLEKSANDTTMTKNIDKMTIMENDKIWRVIQNGYPRKTATDLGLSDQYDAFVVTQLAIYCVTGQTDPNNYIPNSGDATGEAMVTALKKLINIGNTGTEKYTNTFKIKKDGELIEDGEYYSQCYKIESEATVEQYTLKAIEGLKDGDNITDEEGNIREAFRTNQKFKVNILKSNYNSDTNIKLEIDALFKTFPVYYGKNPEEDTLKYVIVVYSYENIKNIENVELVTSENLSNQTNLNGNSSILFDEPNEENDENYNNDKSNEEYESSEGEEIDEDEEDDYEYEDEEDDEFEEYDEDEEYNEYTTEILPITGM